MEEFCQVGLCDEALQQRVVKDYITVLQSRVVEVYDKNYMRALHALIGAKQLMQHDEIAGLAFYFNSIENIQRNEYMLCRF
jgi:hypothetical protein